MLAALPVAGRAQGTWPDRPVRVIVGFPPGGSLDVMTRLAAEQAIRASVQYAFDHPDASRAYVKANAQEMSEAVCQQHIALYVNDFSRSLGAEGRAAIDALIARGRGSGLLPPGPSIW